MEHDEFEKVVLFLVIDLVLHATYQFKIHYPPPPPPPSVPSSSRLSSSLFFYSIINKKYLNHFSLFLLPSSFFLLPLSLPPLLSLSTIIFQHQIILI